MIPLSLKKPGFSLIELLFAMLFMTVIVLGIITLQTSNMTLSNSRQMELRAQNYVAEGLEIVNALGKDAVKTCGAKNTDYSLKKDSGHYSLQSENPVESLEEGLFRRAVQWSDEALTEALLATVTVTWEDSAGSHQVSASRLLY